MASASVTLTRGSQVYRIRTDGAFISTMLSKDGVNVVHVGPNRCSSDRGAQRAFLQEASALAARRSAHRCHARILTRALSLPNQSNAKLAEGWSITTAPVPCFGDGEAAAAAAPSSKKAKPAEAAKPAEPAAKAKAVKAVKASEPAKPAPKPKAPAKAAAASGGGLAGKNVVFTGGLSMHRAKAKKLAEAAGATVQSGITAKTQLVIAGPGAGAKLDAARDKVHQHCRSMPAV
jgi:NAD-dependent DNA ligase